MNIHNNSCRLLRRHAIKPSNYFTPFLYFSQILGYVRDGEERARILVILQQLKQDRHSKFLLDSHTTETKVKAPSSKEVDNASSQNWNYKTIRKADKELARHKQLRSFGVHEST